MIHIEYHKVALIHHLSVANLNGTLRMAASGGAAQFNFIIICFKVLQIVPQLCRRIRKYQNQGAIVIPHTALLALDGRGNNLIKVSVTANQKLHIFLFQKQCVDQRLHTLFRFPKFRNDPMPKETDGK